MLLNALLYYRWRQLDVSNWTRSIMSELGGEVYGIKVTYTFYILLGISVVILVTGIILLIVNYF